MTRDKPRFTEMLRKADAMGIKSTHRHFLVPSYEGVEACAIAGANLAAGWLSYEVGEGAPSRSWMDMKSSGVNGFREADSILRSSPQLNRVCPANPGHGYRNVYDLVLDLHDRHKWTRTEIADYLDATWPDIFVAVPA